MFRILGNGVLKIVTSIDVLLLLFDCVFAYVCVVYVCTYVCVSVWIMCVCVCMHAWCV